jgi:hypothetical protein
MSARFDSDAFGSTEGRVSYLSEPIAALIPLLVERAGMPQRSGYSVASFDLGGGTTDVAVIRVDYESPALGIIEIVPTVLHCTGAHFGGENLTEFLIHELEMRCSNLLKSKLSGATLITENMNAVAALDIRLNRAKLRDTAEQFKASLSKEGNVRRPDRIELRIKEQDGQPSDFSFKLDEITKFGGSDLSRLFLDHTRECVHQVAALLKDAVNDHRFVLNLIHVSGKTALLPVVAEAIQDMFSHVEIMTAPDPKEGVVKGACLSRSLQRGKLRLNLPDSAQRMTSSIGLFTPQNPYFVPVLRADAVLPAEGLVGQIPDLWDGKESIDLWENAGGEQREIDYRSAARWLENLGTWEPVRTVELKGHERWPLRLIMKDFELSVAAIGPNGEQVLFRSTHQEGE